MDKDITLNEERVDYVVNSALKHVNDSLLELRRLFLIEDIVDSIKVCIFLDNPRRHIQTTFVPTSLRLYSVFYRCCTGVFVFGLGLLFVCGGWRFEGRVG